MKNIIYGKNWDYGQNKMLAPFSSEIAKEYFDDNKRFVIYFKEIDVLVIMSEDKSIDITYLKERYEFSYKIIEDDPIIDSKHYFLWRYSVYGKNITKNTNFLIFNHDNGWTHTLHEYGLIELVTKNIIIKNQEIKFSFVRLIDFFKKKLITNHKKPKFSFEYITAKNKVDISSLYMEIPKFAEWDKILFKGIDRVKYLNK